jgi:hypothetical protein
MGYDKDNAKYNNEGKGGLWKKKDKNGQVYCFGKMQIDGKVVSFNAFQNKYKTSDNMPDFQIKVIENNSKG